MKKKQGKIGIFVSGGPGPGINSNISSIVYFANQNQIETLSLKRSFKSFSNDWREDLVTFTVENTTSIRALGGSVIQCSRFNPLLEQETKRKFEDFLAENDIDKLAIIGGDGSTFLASEIKRHYQDLSVVVCPKTIDNDLPLPDHTPTLGFSTARNIGANLVQTMLADAASSDRWFIVTCMGRNTGLLATGVALAAFSTYLVVPEELQDDSSLEDVINLIDEVLNYRINKNRNYGVILLAEGIISKMNSNFQFQVPKDSLGRIQYREILIGDLIRKELRKKYLDTTFIHQDLGFELRGSAPLAYDLEYGVALGYGAVKFLLEKRNGIVIRRWQDLDLIDFDVFKDETGKIKTRCVDIKSELFTIAKKIGLDV